VNLSNGKAMFNLKVWDKTRTESKATEIGENVKGLRGATAKNR